MYRRPKFIEALHKIRQEMAAEADHDAILFAEKARNGEFKENARPDVIDENETASAPKDSAVLRKR
ncbi:MAG: hypothetical protein KF756_01875 [Acidobacteria bacterium]|nr:hypothetical protein [Acidobacteriota bacterium]